MTAHESRGAAMIAPQTGPRRREDASTPDAGGWVPEFPGQRPPFEPGNEAAVTHGARSQKKVEQLAAQIDADLLTRAPWVSEYGEALKAYGRAEAVARMLFNDIAKVGAYDGKGEFRATIFARWATSENTAAKLRDALGLTPRSEAQVARDRAAAAASSVDVVAELARQGRATRAGLDAPGLGTSAARNADVGRDAALPALAEQTAGCEPHSAAHAADTPSALGTDAAAVTEHDREESTDEDDD